MSVVQVAQWLLTHLWLAPLPPGFWYLRRTRIVRAAVTVVSGEIRDRWLRAKNVPEQTRQEIAVDAVRRDLESS
jgi:hypothetical protein